MNWYKKAQKDISELSKEELKNFEFPAAEWGHSITPKKALEKRDINDFETLADLSTYQDQWRFYDALGKGWESHWENVQPSLHLINKIKNGDKITVYRASNTGGILPGAYVTESKGYAIFHGKTVLNNNFKLYQLDVYPDELLTYGDPHEFIYIPRSLDIAHERLKNKSEIVPPFKRSMPYANHSGRYKTSQAQTLKLWHISNLKFNKFNKEFLPQGIVWFSKDKEDLINTLHGASINSKKPIYLYECEIKVDKIAGWDEYEKYTLSELVSMGYDSILLDNDMAIMNLKNILIKKIEQIK